MHHFVYWMKTFTQDTEFPSQDIIPGNSLMVQWLRLGVFTAVGSGLILGRGTKIPQGMQHGRKEGRKEERSSGMTRSFDRSVFRAPPYCSSTLWPGGKDLNFLSFSSLICQVGMLSTCSQDCLRIMEMVGCSGQWFCPRKVLSYCLCFCKMCASFWKKMSVCSPTQVVELHSQVRRMEYT